MSEKPKTNLDDLLAEIAASKPATSASHYSYVMGVFEKADEAATSTKPDSEASPAS